MFSYYRILLAISFLYLISCSGTKIPSSTFMNPNCKTVIEGNYYQNIIWHGRTPALIIKSFSGNSTLYGELIDVNEEGIVFDGEKSSLLSNPAAKKYKYKDIVCAIDENGKIIYGKMPNGKNNIFWKMIIKLASVDSLDKETYEITLFPNRKFSYCMPSGKYTVENISFLVESESVNYSITSEGTFLPKIEIEIEPDCINYIGNLYLNFTEIIEDDVVILPFKHKIKSRTIYSGFQPPYTKEEELSNQPIQYHLLQIKSDTDYKPQKKSNLSLQFTKLAVTNNKVALEMIEKGEIKKYKYKMKLP